MGQVADGRAYQSTMLSSSITPEATSVRTCTVVAGARAVQRRRSQAGPALQLHRPPAGVPVSAPENSGELTVRACTTGSHTRSRSQTRTASSRSLTPTCTWQPHTAGSWAMGP
ncbi:hypothetical protein GCM10020358_67020 [Amorphoplanes nipponensis]